MADNKTTAVQVIWPSKAGVLRTWLYPVGQSVTKGALLADCEPRGVEIRSPVSGQIQKYNKRSGEKVAPNELVAIIQECSHAVQFGGVCAVCGMDVKEFDKSTFSQMLNPINPQLKLTHAMAKEVSREKRNIFLKSRRLALVLDLDKTVLHTTDRKDQYILTSPLPADIPNLHHFVLPDALRTGYFVKFRPHLREFLISASELYEIHVYTADGAIVERVFGDRVITRTHTQQDRSKDLNMIFPHDQTMIVILDDREDVWRGAEQNLINIEPCTKFTVDFFQELDPRRAAATSATAAAQLNSSTDENSAKRTHADAFPDNDPDEPPSKRQKSSEILATPTPTITPTPTPTPDSVAVIETLDLKYYPSALHDEHLLSTLRVMKQVHKSFYDGSLFEDQHNTKTILAATKRQVLKGCSILFTHVFPVTAEPFEQPIWKLAERFGAKCFADWVDGITHVVAGDPGTQKVNEALKRSVFLVSKKWLEESISHWSRAEEGLFPIGGLPVCKIPPIITAEDDSTGGDSLEDLSDIKSDSEDEIDDLAAELESDLQET